MARIRGAAAGQTARDELLKDWLDAHDAHCTWQVRVENVGLLECYIAHAKVFLVQRYNGNAGWEIYIPSHSGNSSLDSLGNASKYIRGEL